MRIKVLVSAPAARADLVAHARLFDLQRLRPGTSLELTATRNGPRGDGSAYDHTLAEFVTLDAGVGAQDEGFDAVCIDEASDAALDGLRSRLDIPVVGAGSGALWLGRLVGLPVAYLATTSASVGVRHAIEPNDEHTAFVVSVGSMDDQDLVEISSVERAARHAAVRGAACIALVGSMRVYRERVASLVDLPVFDATMAAIKLAETMRGLGIGASPVATEPTREVQDGLVADRLRSESDVASPITLDASVAEAPDRRIRVVVPHSDMDEAAIGRRAEVIAPGLLHDATTVEYTGIRTSPNRADSPYATLLMDVFSFEGGLRAAVDGFDALTVDSTSDSGIPGLRSRLSILVLGTGQATWALGGALATRLSILAMEPEWAYFFKKGLRAAHLGHTLASVRDVGTPTDPYNLFAGKEEQMYQTLTEMGTDAVEQDGAEVIVLGSTTMHQAGDHLAAALPAPVLNPGRVTLRSIEAMLEMGLTQSRVAAPSPGRTNDEVFA